MSGQTVITVVGNMVEDPIMRYTSKGTPVANFRIASTEKTFDKTSSQYVDGDTLYLPVNVWHQMGENAAETLTKGMRVIVQGRLKQRSYETKTGEKRSVYELEATEIGPSLRWSTANVDRSNNGNHQHKQAAPIGGFGTGATPSPTGADEDPPF